MTNLNISKVYAFYRVQTNHYVRNQCLFPKTLESLTIYLTRKEYKLCLVTFVNEALNCSLLSYLSVGKQNVNNKTRTYRKMYQLNNISKITDDQNTSVRTI